MNWKIEFDKKAKDDFLKLDKLAKNRILKFIDQRLLKTSNPRHLGGPLKGKFSDLWKYRIGDYRIICKIEDNILVILVVGFGHRREVYRS